MSSSNRTTISDILCEFFEVVVHNILYIRKLYPDTIFVKRKKYGVGIYQSVHPELNEYITNSLKAVQFHTKNRQLRQLFVCVYAYNTIREKYVFDVLKLQDRFENDPMLIRLEQGLRSLLLKLHAAENYLDTLPDDATFTIQLHTSEYSSVAFNDEPKFESFPWVEVTPHEVIKHSSDIVPLFTVDTEGLTLQTYIEKPCDY